MVGGSDRNGKYGFAIDRGGTFTDIYVQLPDGRSRVMKLLSDDPANYRDAPTEGIRKILSEETGRRMLREDAIDASLIKWIRMGTTVATNALLERKGERIALLLTKGFRDLLVIGNQSRPKLFDLKLETPDMLFEEVVEVDERVTMDQPGCGLEGDYETDVSPFNGEPVQIWKKIDSDELELDLRKVYDKGIRSLAVILLHSYIYPKHENQVEKIAKKIGFTNISLSSKVMPMIRAVPRGFTACADAYLTPVIQRYIHGFMSGFAGELKNVLFMQSDGGLCPVDSFTGSRAILSGPAGGVVGVTETSFDKETRKPLIGFDMGGTSTDVSRYAGEFEHVLETETAGITIQATQLDINTVAAGGGSRLFFRSGMLVVGPESAGANPGPVCYRKKGHLAVTDANLILGRILPDHFPIIFGPNEDEPLDKDGAFSALSSLTEEINAFDVSNENKSVYDIALGFIDIANEAMCRPIRALTQAKGYDTSQHVLGCFGGAGGQHACAIAKSLGMKSVFIHKYAGILSAYGLALADVVSEDQQPLQATYDEGAFKMIDSKFQAMSEKCVNNLLKQGFSKEQVNVSFFLSMRYDRTDYVILCPAAVSGGSHAAPQHGDFLSHFEKIYMQEFGFLLPSRSVIVEDVMVRASAKIDIAKEPIFADATGDPQPVAVTKCYFHEGMLDTKVYQLTNLDPKQEISGPAIIIDPNCTVLIDPLCTAVITQERNIRVDIGTAKLFTIGLAVDPIQLSIFSHRFMSIAEQMGRVLQRTSISTNIKERLDFSCALFGPDGGLIANAPHIPVHLGSMQETVKFQMERFANSMKPGDAILSNHPQSGGTHLPDLTVITPVFSEGTVTDPIFFVASRGHHSDIGGLVPGSMPPNATHLNQEGAHFMGFKLKEAGIFKEQELIDMLMAPGKIPDCSGTRNLQDNLADLKAQIAANQKGISLVLELIAAYGLEVVQAYMLHIQNNAELAVRDLLKRVGSRRMESHGSARLHAVDHMDDGTPIVLTITIDCQKGEAVFDFTGTGPEVWNSCNAPRAVCKSAVLYTLRCMVGYDIPLNQGCMFPITLILPPKTIINPSPEAAVCGGNVLTSQRIVDVVFLAFETCAASQGCMNNITFGDQSVGYYETVAGGCGAGPTWHGKSGKHSHMTNTRITDPEILERKYPVILKQFKLRENSGGRGRFNGGNGVVREYLFRRPVMLSIVSERRTYRPYGLMGGEPGLPGMNLISFKSGRTVNIGSKATVNLKAGDSFLLQTPGGGGWGSAACKAGDTDSSFMPEDDRKVYDDKLKFEAAGSLHAYQATQYSS